MTGEQLYEAYRRANARKGTYLQMWYFLDEGTRQVWEDFSTVIVAHHAPSKDERVAIDREIEALERQCGQQSVYGCELEPRLYMGDRWVKPK